MALFHDAAQATDHVLLTDRQNPVAVLPRAHVVALDQLENAHTEEAHGGAEHHVPQSERDGKRCEGKRSIGNLATVNCFRLGF